MKGRIYLSEDRGACALIAAALDVFSHQEEVPGAREVVLWAMETGMDWSRTGWLWPAGEGSGGRSVFYCGVSSGSPIVERSLCYLMPMLGGPRSNGNLSAYRSGRPGFVLGRGCFESIHACPN